MVTLRRFTVVANWKMNVFKTDIDRLADIMKSTPAELDLGKVLKVYPVGDKVCHKVVPTPKDCISLYPLPNPVVMN